jgi:hypothetical protein
MRGTVLIAFVLGCCCCGRGSTEAETIAGCSVPDLGQCTAARYLLSCIDSSNGEEICISDDAAQCPSSSDVSCHDECDEDEYVVMCGFGASPGGEPPSGCRNMLGDPEQQFWCCPCAS